MYNSTPMYYISIFHGYKNDNCQMKNCDIFLILAQNIDCGYMLEASIHNLCFGAQIRKEMYTPVFPIFTI